MTGARRLTAWAVGALIALIFILPAAARTSGRARTEAQLKAVQAEIANAHARARHDQAERQRLTQALRNAELSESAARATLQQLQGQVTRLSNQRAQLAAQKQQREAEMADDRQILAGELRAAYLIGRDEPLKLLLNQRDPAQAGRMLAYYGYFGRARAKLLARISAEAAGLKSLDDQLAAEEQHLTALETQQSDTLGQLDGARLERSAALASLEAQSRTQTERLRRLQRERVGLEHLVRRLRSAAVRRPYAPPGGAAHGPFARLRGTLAWPVAGRLAASFGESRAGGLTWEGDLIDTSRGAPVRAVSAGRVIFANWLPGLGLLIIIDHGGGYMSLYGHNERLYKKVGDEVSAGDLIAAAGDSGGSARPQLYFGIRQGDRPVDPRLWFRTSAPRP